MTWIQYLETLKVLFKKKPTIHAVGPQYGDDLLAYYAVSDCFVLFCFVFPSYREGFPNTVLAAGAMGLPSVVANINGSREIIIEGWNGTIIPMKDNNALFLAMEKMVVDGEWRNNMAGNARQLIMNRFEQNFVQKCLMDYYYEILKKVLCINISLNVFSIFAYH